jgi:hypothetical protein
MVDLHHCVTCGHHERDHAGPLGCARCTVTAQHRFVSPQEAEETLEVLGGELLEAGEFGKVPEHVELQARLFALDMAMKGYDLVTEVMDEPPGIEWVDKAAERYARFLLKRRYS